MDNLWDTTSQRWLFIPADDKKNDIGSTKNDFNYAANLPVFTKNNAANKAVAIAGDDR